MVILFSCIIPKHIDQEDAVIVELTVPDSIPKESPLLASEFHIPPTNLYPLLPGKLFVGTNTSLHFCHLLHLGFPPSLVDSYWNVEPET
jgi:hypothetical protein